MHDSHKPFALFLIVSRILRQGLPPRPRPTRPLVKAFALSACVSQYPWRSIVVPAHPLSRHARGVLGGIFGPLLDGLSINIALLNNGFALSDISPVLLL